MTARKLWQRTGPIAIAVGFALFFAAIDWLQEERGWWEWFGYRLELKLLDQMFKTRGPLETDARVVIAGFDEKAIDTFGNWGSWDRRVYAKAIENLRAAGADTVAFDLVFADEMGTSDTELGRRLEGAVRASGLEDASAFLATKLDEAKAAADNTVEGLRLARAPASDFARLPGPAREKLERGLATVEQGVGDARASVDAARARVSSFAGTTAQLLDIIRQDAEGMTPDEVLAEAIDEHSGNVVLGFIALEHADDPTLTRTAQESFARLESFCYDRIAIKFGLASDGENAAVPMYDESSKITAALRVPDIKGGFVPPIEAFADAAENMGYFSLSPDSDGICRRIPLVLQFGEYLVPSLTLATASLLLGTSPTPTPSEIYKGMLGRLSFAVSDDVVAAMCGRRSRDQATLDSCRAEFGTERIGDSAIVDIPIEPRGSMLVNYYGPQNTTFERISFADVVANTFDPAKVRGKVVLIAATSLGTFDQRVTPFSSFVPGVEVHAAAIQNVIDGKHLVRPGYAVPVEAAGMLLVAILLGVLLRRASVTAGIAAVIILGVAYWALNSFVIFRQGYWFYMVLPLCHILLTWAGITVFGYLTEGREKARIAKQFGTYVSPEYVQELIENPQIIGLSGEERELTVLFSDIRGFTTMSERLAPDELTRFLNEYLTPMTYVLQRHRGTLDKYMGDAIMAFFGAPKWFEDHATQGALTAVEMMEELHELQSKWRQEGKPEVDIGIGLNSGKMRVGDMGSELMKNYTVLGDNVNLGSRLEGINKQYSTNIIASETTFRAAGRAVFGRELDFVAVKGKLEPVRIFEILGRGTPADWQAELIETFERGLACYRAQEWGEAIERFRRCLLLRKEATGQADRTSHTYLERVRLLEKDPPGPDWDGVWKMTTK